MAVALLAISKATQSGFQVLGFDALMTILRIVAIYKVLQMFADKGIFLQDVVNVSAIVKLLQKILTTVGKVFFSASPSAFVIVVVIFCRNHQ